MREFGDPRDPNVDPIDWMHRIPFEETRDYAQKVMSNVQVYRARLGIGAVPLKIADDLVRARGQKDGTQESAGKPDGTGAVREAGELPVKVFE